MTPEEVRDIHFKLSQALGRRVSMAEFGRMFGLSEANAERSVRRWELDGPTGPAAVALAYLRDGLDAKEDVPEWLEDGTWLVRLWYPRMVFGIEYRADGRKSLWSKVLDVAPVDAVGAVIHMARDRLGGVSDVHVTYRSETHNNDFEVRT